MDESGKGIKIITGDVTATKGFKAASTVTEVKYRDRQGMTMIYSQKPYRSTGTFATNVMKVTPVK